MGKYLELSQKDFWILIYGYFECPLLNYLLMSSQIFSAIATDAYRCFHINFLSNWISFRVARI